MSDLNKEKRLVSNQIFIGGDWFTISEGADALKSDRNNCVALFAKMNRDGVLSKREERVGLSSIAFYRRARPLIRFASLKMRTLTNSQLGIPTPTVGR